MTPKSYAEHVLDQIRDLVNRGIIEDPEPQDHAAQAAEQRAIFESVFEDESRATEINIRQDIRSEAGKLMHHKEQAVRDIAAEILRHVRRLETGK